MHTYLLKAVKTGAFIISTESSAQVVSQKPGIQHESHNTDFFLMGLSINISLKIVQYGIEIVLQSKKDYYLPMDTNHAKTSIHYSQQVFLF